MYSCNLVVLLYILKYEIQSPKLKALSRLASSCLTPESDSIDDRCAAILSSQTKNLTLCSSLPKQTERTLTMDLVLEKIETHLCIHTNLK